ncbi:MAG TPA: hypothetical protein VNP72_09555 [Longimicrobium sp.]|nr:hypothetical protein [Longimicrobium sp.]
MPPTSHGRGAEDEMLLPLDSPEASPAAGAPAPRSRRRPEAAPAPAPAPDPRTWGAEAVREVQRRQKEVIDTWGDAVDILTRQIGEEIAHLAETTEAASGDLRGTAEEIRETLASLMERLGAVQDAIGKQSGELHAAVEEQGKALAHATRETASHIGTARHELALSVAQLRRRTFRHGILLGGATAVLVLLAARLLFPFWGMRRGDVEAWSRGTRLLESYRAAPPARQQSILRNLRWESIPGEAPPSASSASRAGGR